MATFTGNGELSRQMLFPHDLHVQLVDALYQGQKGAKVRVLHCRRQLFEIETFRRGVRRWGKLEGVQHIGVGNRAPRSGWMYSSRSESVRQPPPPAERLRNEYRHAMKAIALATAAAILCATAAAHERITLGPRGGRMVYLDSRTIPNLEFLVNKEQRAEITLLDKARKPIAISEQNVMVTARAREAAKTLKVEKKGDGYITEPVPDGAPYLVVIEIKEKPNAKALTARVHYDPTPASAGKPEYLDDSANAGAGPSIQPPETLEGLFGEINRHHGELKKSLAERNYEALEEVTQSLTVLLKAVPRKSGVKESAVEPLVEALAALLGSISDASAARNLNVAAKELQIFNANLDTLKKNYPEETANAKL